MDHTLNVTAGANTGTPPGCAEDEPYDPLDNEYDFPAPPARKAPAAPRTANNDEPYDPFDNDYGPVPPSAQAPPVANAAADNDEPFDPLDNEYEIPASVVEEQKQIQAERARARRESFQAMANLVRKHSGLRNEQPEVFEDDDDDDEEDEDDQDESIDPLACNYPEPDMPDKWRAKVNATGSLNIYVDLATGTPPTPRISVPEEEFDPLFKDCPPLNIVIFIVGSRGDVQPYLALALELIKTRGHRVRLATHGAFKQLIEDSRVYLDGVSDVKGAPLADNLEFFDIGGDPQELMAYMVRNPGLLPGMSSIVNGDVSMKRRMVKNILIGCYRACFSPNETTGKLFAADAIISNPPSFAHIHCAEALGIPLIMSFTMPWTPTTAFPHPLVRMESNRTDEAVNNYSSYVLADALMWQGLGDLINTFRVTVLGLRPLQLTHGPRVLERLKIPYTYAWSPSLLPKPKDWKTNIDIVGFYSMPPDPSSFKEPKVDQAILDFLSKGEPPIYVGFGSIVVKDPEGLTKIVLAAIEKTGVRAILSSGWADLGGHGFTPSDNVLVVKGNIPHDWLFAEGRVSAVCHHGGAGTTAAGLTNGVPTIIVPFFGDQLFWGSTVANAEAGPEPIPYAHLTEDNLTEAIRFALRPETREAAQAVGESIRNETGTKGGVESFHKHLPLLNMKCRIDEKRAALWFCEKYCIRLSGAAAAVLVEEKLITWDDLRPHRSMGYEATRHYTDPFTAFGQSFLNVGAQAMTGTGQLFYAPHRGLSNLFLGVPKASLQVVGSFHEGLDNIPGLMGSPMRDRAEINNFRTGMVEGIKGLSYGIWDGVTGLVTEPIEGAKKSGVGGFFSGMGKSWVNVMARPASGALGLVVLPTTGAVRGARHRMGKTARMDPGTVLALPRKVQSEVEAAGLNKMERKAILRSWEKLIVDELIEVRKLDERKRQTDHDANLLKVDTSSWPVSENLMERLSSRGRKSFVAELEEVAREQDAIDAAAATGATGATGTTSTVERDRSPSSEGSEVPPVRIEVMTASGRTSLNPSLNPSGAPSAGGSMTDLALAGTDRWDWSRPSSRASGGSFTAKHWVKELKELDHRGQDKGAGVA